METVKAIEYLKQAKQAGGTSQSGIVGVPWAEVFDLAIEALNEQRATAHWIWIEPKKAKCSACGYVKQSNGADLTGKALIHKAVYRFCERCGADMRGGKDEES